MGVLWNLYALALGKIMEELTAFQGFSTQRKKEEPHPQPLSLVRRGENKDCRVSKEVRTLFIAESLEITWFLLSTQHSALSTSPN